MTFPHQAAGIRRIYTMPYLLFVAAALFWSGNFVLGRVMHADIPPVALAFWRWSGAAVIVTVLAWPHLKHDWMELKRRWPILLVLSLLGIAAMNTLLYIGLQWTTVVNASLLMALMPALIALFSFAFFGERIPPLHAMGILLSLIGAYAIITRGNVFTFSGLAANRGDLFILLAAAVFAAYSVALRRRPAVHPLSLMAVTFSLGALMLAPFWGWEMANGQRMTLSLPTLLTLAYLMFFPSVVAYFCFNRCIELIGSVRAGFCIHLVPVFSSAIGIALLGEPFVWYHALGTILIAGGILLTTPLASIARSLSVAIFAALLFLPTPTTTKGS